MSALRFHVPLRLQSLSNARAHWRKMDRIKRGHKELTWAAMRGLTLPPPPLVVTITRSGPRELDDDNLAGACKYVRDEIARTVGVDDGSDLYTWRYEQRIGEYGVDVEIKHREGK